ncbi:MAG: hypothetical protein QM723_15010 [Myxococcaceae bacterium]
MTVLLLLSVLAQQPVVPPPSMGDAERQRQAKVLLDEGLKKYEAAQYEAAIESFKAAYAFAPAPGLLFNIAQAYRLWGPGHCLDATRTYNSYLQASPEASNRVKVESHLKSLEKCTRDEEKNAPPPEPIAKVEPPKTDAPKQEPPPTVVPAPVEPAPVEPPTEVVATPRRARWPGLVTGLAGLVVAGVGGGLYGYSGQQYDGFVKQCFGGTCNPTVWQGARTMEQIGVSFLVVGAVVAVAGAVWWLLVSGGQ